MRFEPLTFDAFFAKLRAAGLAVTVADRAAALEVLAQPGSWDLASLRRRLMLVLAHSADEQALFGAVFDGFFFAVAPRADAPISREKPWGLAQFWPLGLAIFVGLAIALLVSRSDWVGRPPTLGASSAGALPSASAGEAPAPPPPPQQPLQLSKHELALEPPRWLPWVLGLGIGVPLSCGLAVVLRARRRRLFSPRRGPFVFELGYPALRTTSPLLAATTLDELATALGAPEPEAALGDFDAERTALLTARRAGITTLAHRPRKQMRRHLLLLQNDERFASVFEHLRALHDQLSERGVELGLFAFSGNPDRVWRVGEPGSTFSLRSLAARFDTLAACGDPDIMLDRDSLAPGQKPRIRRAWLEQAALFYPRLWLTPARFMQRSLGAQLLSREGAIKIEPLGLAAFTALTDLNPHRYDASHAATPGESVAETREDEVLSVVTAWYERYLGAAFPLICAGSLLPQLSSEGLSFLARRCLPALSWDDLVKLHGLPWVLSGTWPNGLRSELRRVLLARFPELATRAAAEVSRLLQEQAPPERSAAFFGYVATELEHRHSLGHDIRPELDRLSRGSARMREQLQKQPGLRESLDANWVVAARLRVLSSWRFAGLALPLALTLAVAVVTAGQALFQRHIDLSEQYRQARQEVLRKTGPELLQCWVDATTLNADALTLQLRSELRFDGRLALSAAPSTLQACLERRYARITIQAPVASGLQLLEAVTLPKIEAKRIEPATAPPPSASPVLPASPVPSASTSSAPTPSASPVRPPACKEGFWYVDKDGDGVGAGEATAGCHTPPFYSTIGGDCNDANRSIRPGQQQYQPAPVDSNCDGKVTPRWPALKRGCRFEKGSCDAGPEGWVQNVPACGEIGELYTGCEPEKDKSGATVRCIEQTTRLLQVCR